MAGELELKGQMAATGLTRADIERLVSKPLDQLPAAWRPVAWDFWVHFRSIPNFSALDLATWLRHWRADGLELEDVVPIFRRMMRPGETAKCRFGSDLMVTLAGEVQMVLDRHRRDRELAEMKAAQAPVPDAERATPEQMAQLRQMLRGLGGSH